MRLKSGTLKTFGYDNKGNQTDANNRREVTYNVFNKPTNINRGGTIANFYYDANWARYKQLSTTNNVTTTTYYMGNYEVIKQGRSTTTLSYIGDTAIYKEVNGAPTIRFTHKDRLGSTTTFTDHNGNATGYRSYDPFGKPKMGNGRTMGSYGLSAKLANNSNDPQNITKRGFTGHEHLDELELIHMNGRVYDYNLGRFMSVDPFIQGVGNSQGINPYSYVMNNPLGYTDPSGYTAKNVGRYDSKSICKFASFGCPSSGYSGPKLKADANNGAKSKQSSSQSLDETVADFLSIMEQTKNIGDVSIADDAELADINAVLGMGSYAGSVLTTTKGLAFGATKQSWNALRFTGSVQNAIQFNNIKHFKGPTVSADFSTFGKNLANKLGIFGLGVSLLINYDNFESGRITKSEAYGKSALDFSVTAASSRNLYGAGIAIAYVAVDTFYGSNNLGVIDLKRDLVSGYRTMKHDLRNFRHDMRREIKAAQEQGLKSYFEDAFGLPKVDKE